MIELLAPAGDEKSFFSAINNGANAVYLGLKEFSARKNADNFSQDNISFYVAYAHALGVKVYVAVNTLIKDNELALFLEIVAKAYSAGVDAFILQDVFLGSVLKENFKDIVLHLSTQAGVNDERGAIFAKEMGFERVILARETQIPQIRKITKIIETEVFVHGALCTCFSGHCYMSAYVGGNSGNRGLCKQPCRKKYQLESSKSRGEYPISLSDLCLASDVGALIDAGVSSFKIEGRMRSPEYVGSAVEVYRKAIDGISYDLSKVKRAFNRGDYTKGYIYGVDGNIVSDKIQNHSGEAVGRVLKVVGDQIVTDRKNEKGDAFKILRDGFEVGNATCEENGVKLKFKGKVKSGDVLSITKEGGIKSEDKKKRAKLEVFARICEGEKIVLSSNGVSVQSDEVLPQAKSNPTTREEIIANLYRTDKYPYEILATVTIEGNPFVPKSILNKLRASLYEKVFFKDVKPFKIPYYTFDFKNNYKSGYKSVVISDKKQTLDCETAFVLAPNDYRDEKSIADILKGQTADKYLFVPAFLREDETVVIERLISRFDGVYADGLNGIQLAKDYGKKLICGLGINVFNSIDLYALSKISNAIILSQELSQREIGSLSLQANVFNFGSIRLMELLYCPFKKDCKNCKRTQSTFTLTDEMGHRFKLRRYKIASECRFEVYNEQILLCANQNRSAVNLIGLDEDVYREYKCGNVSGIKAKYFVTVGNSKRGVN